MMRRITAGIVQKMLAEALTNRHGACAGQFHRQPQGGAQTPGVRLAAFAPGRARCRGPRWCAEWAVPGDVHRVAESLVLDDRQALIVIHRDDHVRRARNCGVKAVSAGNRAAYVEPLRAQLPNHRFDHVDFLAAQVSRTRLRAD